MAVLIRNQDGKIKADGQDEIGERQRRPVKAKHLYGIASWPALDG